MKEYPIKLMNLADLISLNHYIHKNHLHGKVVQKNFHANAGSFLSIAIALPLDSATLSIENSSLDVASNLRLVRA